MENPLAWWRARQAAKRGAVAAASWRAGYDLAAGFLLRDGRPDIVLRSTSITPTALDVGIRCAVRDYNARVAATPPLRVVQH